MKFELNDYHRNMSDEELITDVCNTATKLNKVTLTSGEYNKYGTYHSSTLTRRFGSWKLVLEKCGLETKGHNFKYNMSDEDVIEDLKRVAAIYESTSLTAKEYTKYGKYHSHTLIKHYGTWNAVLKLAGMNLNLNRIFSNEEMFEEIERIWVLLGRQPTTTDIKKAYPFSHYKVMLAVLVVGEARCKRLLITLIPISVKKMFQKVFYLKTHM